MSLLSLVEIHEGREGGDEIDNKAQSKETRTRTYRALVSSAWDGPDVVIAGLTTSTTRDGTTVGPLGSPHPTLANAFLMRRKVKNHPKSKLVFLVTLEYSTDPVVAPDGIPADDPAQISWNAELKSKAFQYDYSGPPALGVCNSAGQPFVPGVQGEDSYWICTVKKNVTFVPTWLLDYRNSVNSAPFMVDGVLVPALCGWMKGLSIGTVQVRNGIAFRPLQFTIACKSGVQLRGVVGGPTPSGIICGPILDDWKSYPLDEGNLALLPANLGGGSYTGPPVPVVNPDGTAARTKVPLDGTGKRLANPTPANLVFIPYLLKVKQTFGLLPLT